MIERRRLEAKHEQEDLQLGNKKTEKLREWSEKGHQIEAALHAFENQDIEDGKIFPDDLLKLFEFCTTSELSMLNIQEKEMLNALTGN